MVGPRRPLSQFVIAPGHRDLLPFFFFLGRPDHLLEHVNWKTYDPLLSMYVTQDLEISGGAQDPARRLCFWGSTLFARPYSRVITRSL